ncbi:MAG: tetratricopeptide repeat protein [Roseivirga sp.]|nr:tetratricopeptide repeat protein [Roseivirga sp.]
MKSLPLILFLCLVLFSCNSGSPQKTVSDPADYTRHMQARALSADMNSQQSDIQFWNDKLLESPESFMFLNRLAATYARRFKANGNIQDIHISDSLYHKALRLTPFSKASIYRALSANAITQHEFPMARHYAEKAIEDGDKISVSYYFLFDALIELGDYEQAKSTLARQSAKNSFDYLTRASKLADHDGDIDLAITLMEQAFERTKNNQNMYSWTKSNLGDMYGHAGRIADSYGTYLEVLEHDPNHWHSWKGIAWIAFAHDKETTEARSILEYIQARSKDPQISLMLAEIADYAGHKERSKSLKQAYYEEASAEAYLGMHNKYLILLEAEDFKKAEMALERALEEVDKRPTPVVYDLLAWTLFNKGEYEKALRIASLFVEGQTQEPDALYHLGMIYQYNGHRKEARKYLNEALESSFELGPITTAAIEKALKS